MATSGRASAFTTPMIPGIAPTTCARCCGRRSGSGLSQPGIHRTRHQQGADIMAAGTGNRAAWPSNDDFTFLSLAVVVIGLAFFGWLGWTNYHADISAVAAALLK